MTPIICSGEIVAQLRSEGFERQAKAMEVLMNPRAEFLELKAAVFVLTGKN